MQETQQDMHWQAKNPSDNQLSHVNYHPEFKRILEQMLATHVKKGADYGTTEEIFANVKASEEFGIPNYIGVCLRMNDKMQRIKQFANRGDLKNESFEDALLDLASYAVIALILYREENPNGNV